MENLNYLWFLTILLVPLPCLIIYCVNRPKNRGGWTLNGHVEPGFEAVKDQFESFFKLGHDADSQLVVYVNDKIVVNLYGKTDPKFDDKTIIPVYSSGKVMASIVMAFMRELGVLDYKEKISKYWPEFG